MIFAEHRRGASLRAISVLLGRSASTIGRELRWGRREREPAQPSCAQRGAAEYRARRKRCGQRMIKLDGVPTLRKVDVRLYTYQAQPLLVAARIYQGQTTNFRTPGGGFAPVLIV